MTTLILTLILYRMHISKGKYVLDNRQCVALHTVVLEISNRISALLSYKREKSNIEIMWVILGGRYTKRLVTRGSYNLVFGS